jgi:hypothetical protein
LKGRGAADRAANLLIRKHGANADLEAANRADLMLDRSADLRSMLRRNSTPCQAGRQRFLRFLHSSIQQ